MGTFSESGAEAFKVKYFDDRSACLAQSPQFYKQMAMAAGFERVFEIGPAFRAEPSFTTRHETEFTSVDVELSRLSQISGRRGMRTIVPIPGTESSKDQDRTPMAAVLPPITVSRRPGHCFHHFEAPTRNS